MARQRTYTDDELSSAVAASRSWRGTLRLLGLAATSSSAIRSVRRRADALGLDYHHFSGQRRWSHEQLVDAVATAKSWDDVVDALGLADRSSATTLKGHAARLGLDVTHLGSSRDLTREQPPAMEPDRANLPRAGSLLAAAWFALCGCDVAWPLEPARYDLLVRLDGTQQRVQVKTGSVRAGSTWTVWLSTTGGSRTTYDPDDIDLFFVIDGDLSYYLIPVTTVAGLHAINVSAYRGYRVQPL